MGTPAARVLTEAPREWQALIAADPAATAAHRAELWSAFTEALPGTQVRLVVVHDGGDMIGGAPVILERRAGFTWLHALPMLLPAAPLALPGRHAEVDAAVARAFAALAHEHGAVGGEWALYRPGGPAVAAEALAPLGGESRRFEAALVDLRGGIEAAWRAIDRKHRQTLQHTRQRGLRFAEDAGALDEAYALHRTQSRRWGAHHPLPIELSRRLLAPRPNGAAARLFTLSDREGVVSSALALTGAHEVLVWWSGTHAEGRRIGAFPLLLWQITEWAAAQGCARVNLGASTGLSLVASFKRSLGARGESFDVRWLDAREAPAPARLLATLQRFVRRGRALGERA